MISTIKYYIRKFRKERRYRRALAQGILTLKLGNRDVRTWDEAKQAARTEFQRYCGRLVKVDCVMGHIHDAQVELYAGINEPFLVWVQPTDDANLTRTNEDYVDPYWDVEVVDPRGQNPGLDCFIDGPSYRVLEL